MPNTLLPKLIDCRYAVKHSKRFSSDMEREIRSGVTYRVNDEPLIFEKFSDDYREMIFRTTNYLLDGIGSIRIIQAPLRDSEYPDISIKTVYGKTIKVKYSDKDVITTDIGVSEIYVNDSVYQYIRDAEIEAVYMNELFKIEYSKGDDEICLIPIVHKNKMNHPDAASEAVKLTLSDAYRMVTYGVIQFVKKVIGRNPFIKTSVGSPKLEFGKEYVMCEDGDMVSMIFTGFVGINGLLFTIKSIDEYPVTDAKHIMVKATDVALGKYSIRSDRGFSLAISVGCYPSSKYMIYDPSNSKIVDAFRFEENPDNNDRTTCTILYEVVS